MQDPLDVIKGNNLFDFTRYVDSSIGNLNKEYNISMDSSIENTTNTYSLLSTIITHNKKDMLIILVGSKKVDVNSCTSTFGTRMTALDIAVVSNLLNKTSLEIIEILLSKGAVGSKILQQLWKNLKTELKQLILKYIPEDEILKN